MNKLSPCQPQREHRGYGNRATFLLCGLQSLRMGRPVEYGVRPIKYIVPHCVWTIPRSLHIKDGLYQLLMTNSVLGVVVGNPQKGKDQRIQNSSSLFLVTIKTGSLHDIFQQNCSIDLNQQSIKQQQQRNYGCSCYCQAYVCIVTFFCNGTCVYFVLFTK